MAQVHRDSTRHRRCSRVSVHVLVATAGYIAMALTQCTGLLILLLLLQSVASGGAGLAARAPFYQDPLFDSAHDAEFVWHHGEQCWSRMLNTGGIEYNKVHVLCTKIR